MMRRTRALCIGCLLSATAMGVYAQTNELHDLLFSEPAQKLADLKRQDADLLAPVSFSEAAALYDKAVDEFRKGREVAQIRKRLSEMSDRMQKIELTLWNGKTLLQETLKAREDALAAMASEVNAGEFNKAEASLREAGAAVESGDTNKARQRAAEAAARYRDAELNAIKISAIGPARDALAAAAKTETDRVAPKTFASAKALLTLAEETLNSNRYAVAEATSKAEQAGYEARHAVQLSRFLKDKKRSGEDIALYYEEAMNAVAKALGFTAAFDTALVKPTQNMIAAIKSLKEERSSLLQDVKELNAEITRLQQELAAAEKQYRQQIAALQTKAEDQQQAFQQKQADLQDELQRKQLELEAKKKREAKIAKVREIFSPAEASVLLDGNRLIIRLLGLSFPVGKSIIQPEYFSLLAKLERALREYPDSRVIIEGHTDNVGEERFNERLSSWRADAVRSYLLANAAASADKLEAIGYGEARPVANNETAEGRRLNRRIDIVIDIQ
ncbi:MAG TPA: OmpA family protein [bacterium]|nr:OmpA family protein [bacterium]